MRNRFVMVERRKDGVVEFYFFTPVELRNGNLYRLGDVQKDHLAAFEVIRRIEEREAMIHG